MGAIVVTEGGIIYGFMRRIKKKLPRPSVDISTEEYLEWENKHSDARNKMLLPMLGSVLGALILIVAVFVLVVGYLF